jgi:hypothetical protein
MSTHTFQIEVATEARYEIDVDVEIDDDEFEDDFEAQEKAEEKAVEFAQQIVEDALSQLPPQMDYEVGGDAQVACSQEERSDVQVVNSQWAGSS